MTRKNNIMGGGAKNSLTTSDSVFKPLIASSLALALGVSVASATNPTLTDGSSQITLPSDFTLETNSGYDVFKYNNSSLSNLMIWIGGDSISFTEENGSGDPELQLNSNATLTSTNGFKMNNGSGTLMISSWANSARVFNLSLDSVVASNYAIYGNLQLEGNNNGTINANLGGKGISGTLLIKSGTNNLIFGSSAKIEGDTTIDGGTNTFQPTSSSVFGGSLAVNGGYTTLLTNINHANGVEITNLLSATSNTLSGGTLVFTFDSTVNTADNKIFNLDTSKVGSNRTVVFSGGTLVFDGAKTIYFNNGATQKQGNGTLSSNGGSVKILIDPTITTPNDLSKAFLKGSLNLTGGSAIFKLKDTSSVTGSNPFTDAHATQPSNTYYVDGSISITNGGFSAFWDDTKGFYGKIATTSGNNLSVSGGLIGKNDIWFADAQNISSIQATSGGVSHLVFNEKSTIQGLAQGSTKLSIRSNQDNATQILFKKGAVITGNITQDGSGYNNITFDATSSITGDIIAKQNHKGNDGTDKTIGNTIVFNHGGTIEGAVTVTVEGGYSWRNYNLNAITFNGTEDATIEGAINATDGGSGRGNVIKFNGSGTNKIVGNISTSPDSAGASGRNYIVFGDSSNPAVIEGSITVQGGINDIEFKGANGVIDGQVMANVSSGNNDGNKITFANGGSITGGVSVVENEASRTGYTLNTITFNGTNNATISRGITSNDGSEGRGNIINFNGTGTNRVSGGISAGVSAWGGAGRNAITFASGSTSSIDGNLETTLGGVNIITFNGENGSITGNISATGNANRGTKGGNQITFANGGSITGNISTDASSDTSSWAGYTQNTITFEGTNNATITGDIFSLDGAVGSKGNTVNFSGSGLNQIIGNITASAGTLDNTNGRNVITFGTSDQTAVIDGSITAENDATYFTYAGGINQINTSSSLTVTGNIVVNRKGANNFDLKTNNITLTLQGAKSKITSLTALTGANNANTLTLDATINNNVDAVIDSVTNSGNLKISFAGINAEKSTKLTLNTANVTNLKSVDVASGKNNTLALSGTGTTTVAGAVSVGANEGLTFDLSSGSSVTFGGNLTTEAKGSTTFILGGTSNTLIGTLTNNGSHTFVVGASSATLRYGSGMSFSSGENNINFKAGASTLNWKKSDGSAFANISTTGGTTNFNLVDGSEVTIGSTSQIITDGGTTNINFAEGGTSLAVSKIDTTSGITNINLVDGGEATITAGSQFSTNGGTANINFVGNSSLTVDSISTASGTTNIKVANGANGILNGEIDTTGGSSVITFLQAQTQGSEPTSSLLLNGATNALTNVVAEGTYGLLASGNSTQNTITNVTLDATGKLAFYNGTSTITTISANNGTLELTTKADAINTVVNASGISGGLNVLFSGSTNDNYHYSTLSLTGTSNQIASVTSNAKNAVIKLDGTGANASATIAEKITIGSGNALIFSLVGTHDATATASKGITVEGGGILGISIGGSTGTKSVSVASGDIDFRDNSTLLIDFQANAGGSVTLGSNAGVITIGDNRNSIINFRGGGKATVNGGIEIAGGNNTVNFLGNGATLSGIELKSGNNTINVASDGTGTGITGTIITSSVGSVTNTINLDDNATLSLKASEGGIAGEGSLISESLNNTLNFKGDGSKLEGSFGAKSATEGKAFINVGSADKTQVSGTITGAVSYANLAFNAGDSKLTLQGTNNTFIDIASQATKGTLVLDTATNNSGVNVEVSGNGTIGAGKELNIEFGGNSASKFEVKGKMSVAGTLGITVNGNGAKTVAGNIDLGGRGTLIVDLASGSGTVSLGDGTQSISIRNGETSIINFADASTASLSNGISLDGGRNELNFARSATVGNIKLNQGTNIIDIAGKEIQAGVTTGNTVELTNIGSVGSVANTINLGKNAEIKIGSSGDGSFTTSLSNTLNFNGESAKFSGGFGASGSGVASINVNATGASITGDVANSSLIFGADATTITLEGTNNTLTTISTPTSKNIQSARMARAVTGNTLTLSTTASRASSTMVSGVINAKDLTVELGGTDATHNATLTLSGGTLGAIKVTSGDASANTLGFRSGTTTIIGAIDKTAVDDTLGLKLNLNGGNLILAENIDTTAGSGLVDVVINNATLQLRGTTANVSNGLVENKINSLSGNGVVDLAVADFDGNTVTRSVRARAFKTFTIANYSGNHTFNLYVDPKNPDTNGYKADQVIVTSGSGSATFTVTGNIDDILGITYEKGGNNNVQVASGMDSVEVSGGDSLIGYDIIQAQVIKDGGNVYLGQAISKGVAQEIKDVASSALTVNYDLFLANFNSLNKRMGELRDNANSQGVWTRVFGGAMSNDFGAGSKTEYVTAQAGYDYSLTLGDAKNYMGIAVAYGHSTTKSNTLNIQASQGATIALQDVKSNMVEVGIYNSYVMDSGWYNDTIFKFDYIMSSFTMTDNLSLESETNNFAMVLSDEFGYRYKFAENEKGNWYIDPQVEVAFGYFNQSDFNRAMLATNSTLEATQDNILTLRTRAGLSLGKKFNTAKGFASLYVGAFYEYDYINGGDAEVLSKSGIANPLDKLESNGRAIVNVGSNIELTEGVRMYIDVEKSFGDKQRTDMQFNFGARYSFGEKTPTISYQEAQKKRVAPLKVEEKQEATTQSATQEQEAKN